MKVYTAAHPAALVSAHALDAGPPVLPPKWMYTPWRWRDEHTQRTKYYDGTPVTGPFNSEMMEDVLMMKAYGIPCGVYWIDRPWGPGRLGYDDFEIDPKRLPNFAEMVKWLNDSRCRCCCGSGRSSRDRWRKRRWKRATPWPARSPAPTIIRWSTSPIRRPRPTGRTGSTKLLKLGVAGFKLDRAEEQIPESGPFKRFDGHSIRENRNAYPPMYRQGGLRSGPQISRRRFRGDAARRLHRQFALRRVLGRRHRRHAEGLAGLDHRGAARGGDGLSQLGFRHLRLQPAVAGPGYVRPLAGLQLLHSDHGGGPDAQCGILESSARAELRCRR